MIPPFIISDIILLNLHVIYVEQLNNLLIYFNIQDLKNRVFKIFNIKDTKKCTFIFKKTITYFTSQIVFEVIDNITFT